MATIDRILNYFERNPQLRVLFVFDQLGGYEAELHDVAWPEGYVYKLFDGRWLNLKLAIAREWSDKRVVLLLPSELRPTTEEKRLRFPLLDVLAANMEFKDAAYDEFIQQHGLPQSAASFVKRNIQALASAKVQTILSGYMNEDFKPELGCRAIISSYLGERTLLDWEEIIVRLIILSGSGEEKKSNAFFIRLADSANRDLFTAVNERLIGIFGITYDANRTDKMRRIAEILKYNAITQSLSAMPADNYKALKITGRTRLDQINRIYEKGLNTPGLSAKFKKAMDELGADIRESELINVYGTDAPFFYMNEAIGRPIIADILTDTTMSDPVGAIGKVGSLRLRLGTDSPLIPLMDFTTSVANYYEAVSHLGTLRLDTPEEYITLYTDIFSNVDTSYRQMVEAYYKVGQLDEDLLQSVEGAKRRIDAGYAQLCNDLNREWLDCLADSGRSIGQLGLLRQDCFFSTYYNPTRKFVVIVSDALRYDVAKEMIEKLGNNKHVATLSPMLSLLPTETKYCKPALLPHDALHLRDDNMEVDGKVLATIKQRTEHVRRYQPTAVCVNFKDVCTQINSHRELFKNQLVYVLHDRIDSSGHGGTGEDVADNCRKTIKEIADFVHSLHMSLNCYNVYITADHGFLFNDIPFEEKDKISIKEDTFDSTTRYYLTHSATPVDEVVKMELSDASPIQTDGPVYVATPKGTNRFAAPGGYGFAHGGASLQELIVPVIYSNARKDNTKQTVGVVLRSANLSMTSSRLRFQLVQKEAVTMGIVERDVVCQVYDGDNPVTDAKQIKLNSTDALNIGKRTHDIVLTLNKPTSGGLLQLRVYDTNDKLNPLITETVKNNTIIEQDF